jgi:hypothetical protein
MGVTSKRSENEKVLRLAKWQDGVPKPKSPRDSGVTAGGEPEP